MANAKKNYTYDMSGLGSKTNHQKLAKMTSGGKGSGKATKSIGSMVGGAVKSGVAEAAKSGMGYKATATNRATGQKTTTYGRTTPVTKDEFNSNGRMNYAQSSRVATKPKITKVTKKKTY